VMFIDHALRDGEPQAGTLIADKAAERPRW
jgi:hypothetical protein